MTHRITGVPNTCPDIDNAKKIIDNIQYDIENTNRQLNYVVDILEELRESNSALRDKAHEYYEKIIELENDITRLERGEK